MRAKLRGLIAHPARERLDAEIGVGVLVDPALQLAQRGPVRDGARELDAELRLPTGPPQEQHELARDVARELAAEVVLEQREREVHARGDARGGRDPPVAHVDAIGLDPHAREQPRERGAAAPVRGRAAAVEQPRAREQERARADPGHAARARVHAPDPVDRRRIERGAPHALAARDEQRVDRPAHVARRALRHELEARRHAHRPRARGHELHRVARIAPLARCSRASSRVAIANTSSGPVTSRICASGYASITIRRGPRGATRALAARRGAGGGRSAIGAACRGGCRPRGWLQ